MTCRILNTILSSACARYTLTRDEKVLAKTSSFLLLTRLLTVMLKYRSSSAWNLDTTICYLISWWILRNSRRFFLSIFSIFCKESLPFKVWPIAWSVTYFRLIRFISLLCPVTAGSIMVCIAFTYSFCFIFSDTRFYYYEKNCSCLLYAIFASIFKAFYLVVECLRLKNVTLFYFRLSSF